MARRTRTTGPILDVSLCLLQAHVAGVELHGWAIMHEVKRSGPTVYGVLDRLEDRGWIVGSWEDQDRESNKPRRRFYRLTPEGLAAVRDLLAERRPEALENLSGAAGRRRVAGWQPLAPGSAK